MTDRPPLHPLSIAGLALGSLAAIFTAVLLSMAWHNPHLYPSDRNGLWLQAWMNRWGWPPLATSLAGWVVSAIAIERLTSRRGLRAARGLGWARLGLALSIGCGGMALLGMLVIPVALRPQEAALKVRCLSNVKFVATALNMYADEWDRFPPADKWIDLVRPNLRAGLGNDERLRCPDAAGKCAYAFNGPLDQIPASAITEADKLVMLFESDRGWNAHGGRELLTDFPRHMGGDNLGFADGHAKWRARVKPPGEVDLSTKWPHEYLEQEGSDRLEWELTPGDHGETAK